MVEQRQFGSLGQVSRLSLGGGGIGHVWGETSQSEGRATLFAALDAGINLIDAAPAYNLCEQLIGDAFNGKLPAGVRITTKFFLNTIPRSEVYPTMRASLEKSLQKMSLDRVDILFLHNELCPDDFIYPEDHKSRDDFATTWSLYRDAVIPAFERLMAEGMIAAWGLTGVSVPEAILAALNHQRKPDAIQAVANLLDSPGGLTRLRGSVVPRKIAATASSQGVGVMGIRVLQAGALTDGFDRPVADQSRDGVDWDKAGAFRALCKKWGDDPATVAYRYALSMEGIDTIVLGAKNRRELKQSLLAEEQGALELERVTEIDELGLRAKAP